MEQQFNFKAEQLEKQIPKLKSLGITEFSIHDLELSKNKTRLLHIINLIEKYAKDVFVNLLVDNSIIDKEIINAALKIFCSIDIPILIEKKGDKILFDKKFYAKKAALLNQNSIVFGYYISYAQTAGDSLKAFMDRLDFAVQQYPNHIDFPQTQSVEAAETSSVSQTFSAKDIRYARDVAFACRTFYSSGRAVPWFLSVLYPLRLYPSKFFADFAEWQLCNNCDYKSGFIPEEQNHKNIEKMQLVFLEQKYEEKNKKDYLQLITDIIKINGAISRLYGEEEASTVITSYNPDDLLSPESTNLEAFLENICMESCKTKFFIGKNGPDYTVENAN